MAADNAFELLRSAGEALQEPEGGWPMPGSAEPLKAAVLEPILARNERALELVRQARGRPYQSPPWQAPQEPRPWHTTHRQLASLLVLEAQWHVAHSRWADAVASCLDGVELGIQAGAGEGGLGHLVATTVQIIARRELWPWLARLNPDETSAALARVLALLPRQVPFADALRAEIPFGVMALDAALAAPYWRLIGLPTVDRQGRPARAWVVPWATRASLQRGNDRRLARLIAWAEEPWRWPPPLPAWWSRSQRRSDLRLASRRVNSLYSETFNALLASSLALQAYRQAEGRAPDDLAELCPRHLPAPLADPFGTGSLCYRWQGEAPLLYSVGPDGRDDGGVPVESVARPDGARIPALHVCSGGDVVAMFLQG